MEERKKKIYFFNLSINFFGGEEKEILIKNVYLCLKKSETKLRRGIKEINLKKKEEINEILIS